MFYIQAFLSITPSNILFMCDCQYWLSLPTAAAGAAGAAAVTDTVTVLCVVIVTVCVDACVVTPVFCDCVCVTGHVEMCRSGTFTHAQ